MALARGGKGPAVVNRRLFCMTGHADARRTAPDHPEKQHIAPLQIAHPGAPGRIWMRVGGVSPGRSDAGRSAATNRGMSPGDPGSGCTDRLMTPAIHVASR